MQLGNEEESRFWFALHLRVRHERVAADALRSRGLEQFLPLRRTRRRWSDRMKELTVPLFSRYVFCRFNAQERLQVLTAPGVEYAVGIGKVPVPIPDVEVAALQSVVRSGVAAQAWPFLQTGQWVRIEAGPLAGLEGILLDFRGQRRLVISVALLQRSVALEIDRWDITPIAPPPTQDSLLPRSLPFARSISWAHGSGLPGSGLII